MSPLQRLSAAVADPRTTEREVRQLALRLSRAELDRAWDEDLLTVHQYETVLGLRGWTAAVSA